MKASCKTQLHFTASIVTFLQNTTDCRMPNRLRKGTTYINSRTIN